MSDIPQTVHELTADASAQRIARVYAEALLDAAQARHAAAEVLEELEVLLRDVAGQDPLLGAFFMGGTIGRAARRQAIERAFGGRVSDLFLDFLLVLNDHERLELLRPIRAAYVDLLNQRMGQVRVLVRSAVPLDDAHLGRLVVQLKHMTGREPVLEVAVDPALLGGMIVRVGDYLYDTTVKTRLEKIKNQLLERSSHAIQTGRDRFSLAEGN
jgi:F-type H+-transporting ATPase subunit delta